MTVDPKSRVQPSFLLQLWVRTALDDSARVAGNWIREPIYWFSNWFDQASEQNWL